MRDSKFVEVLNTGGGLDRIQRECEDEEPAVFVWFKSSTNVSAGDNTWHIQRMWVAVE